MIWPSSGCFGKELTNATLMQPDRRKFLLSTVTALTTTSLLASFYQTAQGRDLLGLLAEMENHSGPQLAEDETFWYQIRQAYTVSPALINLNNGGVSPQPKVVQEAVERYNQISNETPTYYMWRILDNGREPIRRQLAALAGCSQEEIAIQRNSSEALETIIFGLRLKAGDEVVLTKQDYPNMINAWKQRAHRDGIVLKWLDFDFPTDDNDAIVATFAKAFTEKTKVVHLTHVINWMGQVLPVAAIAKLAHEKGIEVLVDGAHSFAQFPFAIPDLQCDYFGTSLHKWLCAPYGTGMLYVKKDKIQSLYPLFGSPDPESDDIRKYEHLGTRSFAIEQAIGQAIHFHDMIGAERKAERLLFLRNYWVDRVKEVPKVTIASPAKRENSCAIALLAIEGYTPRQVHDRLYREFKIHTTAIVWENISGVRITPNVYTLLKELDVLVDAIKHIAAT